MNWLRWYHGACSDPKWPIVARRAGVSAGVVVSVWAALLEQASQADERGSLDGFDCETFDALYGYPDGTCQAVFDAMREKGLVRDGRIGSWARRQPLREDSGGMERKRRQRAQAGDGAESAESAASAGESPAVEPVESAVEPVESGEPAGESAGESGEDAVTPGHAYVTHVSRPVTHGHACVTHGHACVTHGHAPVTPGHACVTPLSRAVTPEKRREDERRADETGYGEKTPPDGGVAAGGPPACPHARIVELYHETLPQLARVKTWTGARQKHLQARWRERWMAGKYHGQAEGLDYWKRLFVHIREECDFLMGRVPGSGGRPSFRAHLGWLVKPENFARLIEGCYDRGRTA